MTVFDYSDVDDESITASRYLSVESDIKRTKRDTPPAHYILKIKSFIELLDILTKTGDEHYECDEFKAGGYKWKLIVYPIGNEKGNGEDHISMYIASTDRKVTSNGCHVNALISFFVYDHYSDKYLTIQDGKVKRFHVAKTEHGIDQVLSLDMFNDSSNGYRVNDCCIFGAEVHVIENTAKVSEFSVITDPETFTWKIDKFSSLQKEYHYSDTFNFGGYKWKLMLYPRGDSDEKDKWMSLFLVLHKDSVINGRGVYAECKMSMKDQIHGNHHKLILGNEWFKKPGMAWGFGRFFQLSEVDDASKGFIVNDTLVIEADITLVSAL